MSAGEATESNFFYQSSRLSFPGTHRKRIPGQNLARIVLCMYYRGTCPRFCWVRSGCSLLRRRWRCFYAAFNIGIGPWKVAKWVAAAGIRCWYEKWILWLQNHCHCCYLPIQEPFLSGSHLSDTAARTCSINMHQHAIKTENPGSGVGIRFSLDISRPNDMKCRNAFALDDSPISNDVRLYVYVLSLCQVKTAEKHDHAWSTLSCLDNAVAYKSEVWHANAGWITESRRLVWICKHCKH